MQTPLGPSLQLILAMVDPLAEVSLAAAESAWHKWFGTQRFHRRLAQFESQGWMETKTRTNGVDRVVRLTTAGRVAALGGRDPVACWSRSWDGRWRLALFDVPETQRTLRMRLWRKLRALGFGHLQRSVWLSPDFTDQLKDALRGSSPDVGIFTLMEARPCGGESDNDLVLGAWDFDRINRNYLQYLEVLQSEPSRASGRSWQAWFDAEWKAWTRALSSDPLLPEELLPAGYRGREAWRQRMERVRTLFRSG